MVELPTSILDHFWDEPIMIGPFLISNLSPYSVKHFQPLCSSDYPIIYFLFYLSKSIARKTSTYHEDLFLAFRCSKLVRLVVVLLWLPLELLLFQWQGSLVVCRTIPEADFSGIEVYFPYSFPFNQKSLFQNCLFSCYSWVVFFSNSRN